MPARWERVQLALVDAVLGPPLPELRALRRQLRGQCRRGLVVRFVADVEAEIFHDRSRLHVPVPEQCSRLVGQEHPAGGVAVRRAQAVEVGQQGVRHAVAGQHVGAPAQDERRVGLPRFEELVQSRPYPLDRGHPPAAASRGRADQVAEVGAARRVQAERPGDRVQDPGRRGDAPALLQAGVVVGRDAGQQRDLLAAQPGHAPDPLVGGQARTGRIAFAAGAAEEVGQLPPGVGHDLIIATGGGCRLGR
jgi:hypothetical protein